MIITLEEMFLALKKAGIQCRYIGDLKTEINGFSSIKNYKTDTFTWVKSEEYWEDKFSEFVNIAIVQEGVEITAKNQIIAERSKEVFFFLIEKFFGEETSAPIGQFTYLGENVKLGKNVYIGSNCSIDGDIKIGDNTIISDNVVIKNKVNIGQNCFIQAMVIIGEDGFGCYEDDNHKKTMVKHHGGVVIGDNVFIGCHTNIARGTIDDTIIGNGVKIAPSSHIGHNNVIDEDVVFICAQSYGSVHIKENAYIVGSIIKNQMSVGKNSLVGMGSVVTKSVEDNKVVVGAPAKVIRDN